MKTLRIALAQIDPTVGENRQVDWSRLEDVELRVEYTFQDLFPAGQCE